MIRVSLTIKFRVETAIPIQNEEKTPARRSNRIVLTGKSGGREVFMTKNPIKEQGAISKMLQPKNKIPCIEKVRSWIPGMRSEMIAFCVVFRCQILESVSLDYHNHMLIQEYDQILPQVDHSCEYPKDPGVLKFVLCDHQ